MCFYKRVSQISTKCCHLVANLFTFIAYSKMRKRLLTFVQPLTLRDQTLKEVLKHSVPFKL